MNSSEAHTTGPGPAAGAWRSLLVTGVVAGSLGTFRSPSWDAAGLPAMHLLLIQYCRYSPACGRPA